MKNQNKLILRTVTFILILNIYSCCLFKTDSPDLRITGQNVPPSAGVSQTFSMSFTVSNISAGECDAAKSNSSAVNLKMVNRASGFVQVNNTYEMNPLENNSSQTFPVTANIGTAGTYDLTFTVDPNNTSGESNRNNNTYTAVVIIQ